MAVEFKNLSDVFDFHREVAGRIEAQMKALREAKPRDLPDLLTAAGAEALQRARAALAQATDERTQGLRYHDERVERQQAEVDGLEAALKHARELAAGQVQQIESLAAGAEPAGAGSAPTTDTAPPDRPTKGGKQRGGTTP